MDQEGRRTFPEWFERVMKHVRFKPDRDAIERELEGHYEDHCRDLLRLGYEEPLAQERAIRALGDPETVGKALNAAHKPWLGWLWLISKCASILTVTAAIVYALVAGPLSGPITELWPKGDPDAWDGDYTRIREFYWTNEEGEPEPWWKPAELVATGRGAVSVERAGYTLTVPHAETWEMMLEDGRMERFYFVTLTVEDRYFWDNGPRFLTRNLTLEDACGRYFDDNYYDGPYAYDENGYAIWGPADGHLRVDAAKNGAFSTTYFLYAHVLAEPGDLGAEAELRYPYGTPWSLTIEWEEVPDA